MKQPSVTTLKIANWLSFVLTVAVNALAVTLPLNGKSTQQLSDQYPNLFVPAGLTFSIWGVIYLGLLLFILYQSGIFGGKLNADTLTARLGWLPSLVALANVTWIFLWHWEQLVLSLFVMLALLVLLIALILRIGRPVDTRGRWFALVPFSLYLGWISVATIANATAVLVGAGWGGWGIPQSIWAVVMIAAAALLGAAMLLRRGNIAYSLVIIWALAGIAIKHVTVFNSAYPEVLWAVALAVAANIILIIYTALRARKANDHAKPS